MIKTKKQMYIIIGVFVAVLALFTTTYAFFNYTRTGSANTIRTGRIAFNSTQGQAINLTNVFPIDVSNGVPNNNPNVGSVTINVTGDTTYTNGVEYKVSAVNVSNTTGSGANAKSLPISVDVSVTSNTHGEEPNQTTTTLGTADSDYFTHHGPNAETSIYKVLAGETITNNDDLLVGYIKSGATGVDGNIVIKAYIDASKVAITDTYPERTVRTVRTTGYDSEACETALAGASNVTPATVCETASDLQDAIDNEDLTDAQIRALVVAGIVSEYTDGTQSTWVGDRQVFTTSEWNSLQQNGISFQVRVESNEGIWVEEPAPALPTMAEMCPNCVFMYTQNTYNYGTNGSTVSDIENNGDQYYVNYADVVSSTNINWFLGFTLDNNRIDRAFACGIKQGDPNDGMAFCIEGTTDNSKFNSNAEILSSIFGPYDEEEYVGCNNTGDIECSSHKGETWVAAYDDHSWASVHNGSDGDQCHATTSGTMECA